MESLKMWALSTCVTIVIVSIIKMVIPNGANRKIIRFLVSGFIILGIVTSLLGFSGEKGSLFDVFSLKQSFSSENRIELDEKTADCLRENVAISLYPVFSEFLKKKEISEFSINVELEVTSEGAVIKRANISVADLHKNSREALERFLTENTGLDVCIDVINWEGT